jgi:threonine/homoserine/homoserine lactone efflux protein
MITAVLAGLVAGYGIAVPVGAVAAYLITLGAAHGFRTAAAGGLGAATVDTAYAAVAVVLGAVLAPLIMAVAIPLRWLSALVLVGVAVTMIISGLRPVTSVITGADGDRSPDAPSPRRAYATVLVITLVNPATLVYFAALVAGSTVRFDRPGEAVIFVAAAGLASASWQLVLAGAGAGLSRVLSGPAARRWTAVVGAVVVLALAGWTVLAG